jgi:hypothetical protein
MPSLAGRFALFPGRLGRELLIPALQAQHLIRDSAAVVATQLIQTQAADYDHNLEPPISMNFQNRPEPVSFPAHACLRFPST